MAPEPGPLASPTNAQLGAWHGVRVDRRSAPARPAVLTSFRTTRKRKPGHGAGAGAPELAAKRPPHNRDP
jgi:hypothetical protein